MFYSFESTPLKIETPASASEENTEKMIAETRKAPQLVPKAESIALPDLTLFSSADSNRSNKAIAKAGVEQRLAADGSILTLDETGHVKHVDNGAMVKTFKYDEEDNLISYVLGDVTFTKTAGHDKWLNSKTGKIMEYSAFVDREGSLILMYDIVPGLTKTRTKTVISAGDDISNIDFSKNMAGFDSERQKLDIMCKLLMREKDADLMNLAQATEHWLKPADREYIQSQVSKYLERAKKENISEKQVIAKIAQISALVDGSKGSSEAHVIQAKDVASDAAEPKPKKDVAAIPTRDFEDVAIQVLRQINPLGKVTKVQLAKALEDPSFTGQKAQALAALYEAFDQLCPLNHTPQISGLTPGNERAFVESYIDSTDIKSYQKIANKYADDVRDSKVLQSWAEKNLKAFAHDDEMLTMRDIKRAMRSPTRSKEEKEILNLFAARFSDLSQYYGVPAFGERGIKLQDIKKFSENVYASKDAELVSSVLGRVRRTATDAQAAAVVNDLYASKNPLESIKPEAIVQGMIGNCYFESALAAVAVANPQIIRDSIVDNQNGTFTVTFKGLKNEQITVKAPTEAERGLYNAGSKYGLWAAVMEKAYGKYRDNHAWVGSNTPQEGADGGGRPEPVIELLTGRKAACYTIGVDQNEIINKLETAFKSNPPKPVTAGIYGDFFFWRLIGASTDVTAVDKFQKCHEYTITGFRPDGKGGYTVTVRNPWGGDSDTVQGSINISLKKFMDNFNTYSLQED